MAEKFGQQGKVGVSLVVVSAVVFSLAGIFTKGVEADAWDIIFWRGLAAAGFTFGYLSVRGHLRSEGRAIGRPGLAVAILMAAGTAAFIPAFKLSTVANVAMIYGAAPLIAALLAWLFIRERPANRVLWASAFVFCGVLIIFHGSFAAGHLAGDFLALFMTLMMAGTMVVYRQFPATPAAFPAGVSSLLLIIPAGYLGDPFAVSGGELPILICFGLVFAIASVALSEGARRLPPAETALLSILEMPLAPIFALIILGAMPSTPAIFGGALIIVAVIWSQARRLF